MPIEEGSVGAVDEEESAEEEDRDVAEDSGDTYDVLACVGFLEPCA